MKMNSIVKYYMVDFEVFCKVFKYFFYFLFLFAFSCEFLQVVATSSRYKASLVIDVLMLGWFYLSLSL